MKSYGIDIGTTFLTLTAQRRTRPVLRIRHEGKVVDNLKNIFEELDSDALITFTGKGAREITERLEVPHVRETVAVMRSVNDHSLFPGGKGRVIDIGAASLAMYTFRDGKITDIQKNALCAAGTGLFLEEQAERLGVDLEGMGELTVSNPPLVASRCTVFAKSDLIHHQQEGRSKEEMWAGLCRSLVVSAMNTLFRGEKVLGEIAVIGGVSLNREVVRWMKILYPEANWIVPEGSDGFTSLGAAGENGVRIKKIDLSKEGAKRDIPMMKPLLLKKSSYPKFEDPVFDKEDNEIRIHRELKEASGIAIGMDIGSTSTKLVALRVSDMKPVFDIYRKTGGDPVGAARKVFRALYGIVDDHSLEVLSFGTTGSGRKLVGEIFGADSIVNEITAHGTGTGRYYPDVETIFEIGGQDAKYISMKNGFVSDVNMNYVCAAGTGSFVEEQARKLGFSIFEAGDVVEGIAPPVTSDRCTVFMEQDLRDILKKGFSKEEALASVMYSVIRNYLTKVVGKRPVNRERVFFQGATARNRGLVAAIENILDVEVVVSPFCHLMGSIGSALISYESLEAGTRFIGKESMEAEIESRTETCKLCENFCRINFIKRVGGDEFSWGYQCGRDPNNKKRNDLSGFSLIKERNRLFFRKNETKNESRGNVTIIHSLTNHTFYPMWQRFFNMLDIKVRLSSVVTTDAIKRHSSNLSSADYCFPAKSAMGHMMEASSYGHPMFQPFMIADSSSVKTADSYFCCYAQGSPAVMRSVMERNGIEAEQFISPVVDLRLSEKENATAIYEAMKENFNVSKRECIKAFSESLEYFRTIQKRMQTLGDEFLEKAAEDNKPVFVLVGRPYNIYDKGINLGIPEAIASMGYPVVPLDMLSLDVEELAETDYFNMFWRYGQRILSAIDKIRKSPNIFPIYLTNFNCGPDSFILSYAEEESEGKPMLILELDEHDSDGGYRTRIEAFVDVVGSFMKRGEKPGKARNSKQFNAEYRADLNGKVWIPPMHYVGARLFAATFRGFGYDSGYLDFEDKESLELGKRWVRGGECLPMTLTIGAFMKKYFEEQSDKKQILFMPTSEGPCRFGQYNLLERRIFEKAGMDRADIMSPSGVNAYQGLPEDMRRFLMHTMMSSDIMLNLLTRVRPYEKTKGDTIELFEKSIAELEELLSRKENPKAFIKSVTDKFSKIPVRREQRPLVGIVGEMYVRNNHFSNGSLIDVIEANGGEAWLTPMHEYILYTAYYQSYMTKRHGKGFFEAGESLVKNIYLYQTEKSYMKAASKVLGDRKEPDMKEIIEVGKEFFPVDFSSEAVLTAGRASIFARQGASMVVNASPFGCMPGTIASSIFLQLKERYGIPMVSMFYDGDLDVNDKVGAMIHTLRPRTDIKRPEKGV